MPEQHADRVEAAHEIFKRATEEYARYEWGEGGNVKDAIYLLLLAQTELLFEIAERLHKAEGQEG